MVWEREGGEGKGRERERALYRGREGSASAWFGGGIIIAQCVSAGVAFSTKSSAWHGTRHEAERNCPRHFGNKIHEYEILYILTLAVASSVSAHQGGRYIN